MILLAIASAFGLAAVEADDSLPPLARGVAVAEISLHSGDGTTVYADWYRARGRRGTALVIAPGFIMHKDQRALMGISRELSRHTDVLCLSLRGHGKSSGKWTHGEKDYLDVLAGICEARAAHENVRIMGFSMGAAAAVRAAAACRHEDPVALVSPPTAFRDIWLRPGVILGVINSRPGHGTIFSVRQINGLTARPDFRGDAAKLRAPALVVHGSRDRLIPIRFGRELYDAIPSAKRFVTVENGGHAEDLYVNPDTREEFLRIVRTWLAEER